MSRPDDYAPIAITRRSGVDESVHFGALVAIGANGKIEFALGDPDAVIYPRSSNKPMQAVAMVRAGLVLPPEMLALVCASHDGSPTHLDITRRILASVGLDESALANTVDLPLDDDCAEAVLRAGGGRSALQMNCSGKHAGMLATCVINGWACNSSYLDQHHPLQRHIVQTIAEMTDAPVPHVGVDGCGAPAHTMTLMALARCFQSIATGAAGTSGEQVYNAMTTHPAVVGGDRRDVTQFMRHVPGLVAKDGAEGVFAAALPDGRAVALKIADGANRARPPVMLSALAKLGISVDALAPLVAENILGHGRVVGDVRSLLS